MFRLPASSCETNGSAHSSRFGVVSQFQFAKYRFHIETGSLTAYSGVLYKEHSRMKLVHILLTPFRSGSLFAVLGTRETTMAVLERSKAKIAAKANARPMGSDEFFEFVSKRYPKIIARLAE